MRQASPWALGRCELFERGGGPWARFLGGWRRGRHLRGRRRRGQWFPRCGFGRWGGFGQSRRSGLRRFKELPELAERLRSRGRQDLAFEGPPFGRSYPQDAAAGGRQGHQGGERGQLRRRDSRGLDPCGQVRRRHDGRRRLAFHRPRHASRQELRHLRQPHGHAQRHQRRHDPRRDRPARPGREYVLAKGPVGVERLTGHQVFSRLLAHRGGGPPGSLQGRALKDVPQDAAGGRDELAEVPHRPERQGRRGGSANSRLPPGVRVVGLGRLGLIEERGPAAQDHPWHADVRSERRDKGAGPTSDLGGRRIDGSGPRFRVVREDRPPLAERVGPLLRRPSRYHPHESTQGGRERRERTHLRLAERGRDLVEKRGVSQLEPRRRGDRGRGRGSIRRRHVQLLERTPAHPADR